MTISKELLPIPSFRLVPISTMNLKNDLSKMSGISALFLWELPSKRVGGDVAEWSKALPC